MIIHPKFVFLHLPKTGGTFVENYLTMNVKGSKYIGQVIQEYLNDDIVSTNTSRHDSIYKVSQKTKDHIKFGYIRNPYDWYLSFWTYSRAGKDRTYNYLHNKQTKEDINIFIKHISNIDLVLCYYTNSPIERMKELSNIDLGIAKSLDIGLYTYKYLYTYYHPDVFKDIENYEDYSLVDKILKFENLREELNTFFKENLFELNAGQTILLQRNPKLRVTRHRHYKEDYYSKEVIDLIRHKDRIIFDKYDYEF